MSILTNLTRMWLTRSFKPFIFTNKYSQTLDYINCDKLGLYVHIPFCRSICNFCPYCKYIYKKDLYNKYVDFLIKEIHLVGNSTSGRKKVTSLYFGGGSPAMSIERTDEILDAIYSHFIITDGMGIELHPDDITDSTMQTLYNLKFTKISVGIQSFNSKFQDILKRKEFDSNQIKSVLTNYSFETISIDLIFALPTQTFEDLKSDVEKALAIGANHIAIYPFIDFSFTASNVHAMDNFDKKKLLYNITDYFYKKGFVRTSIWTFAKSDAIKYSSMTRENFLGFGCSATTLLKEQFKINTFSINEYCKRIDKDNLPTSLTINFTRRQRMVYYLFWTAYSTQINPSDFYDFFGVTLEQEFGLEIQIAKMLGFIVEDNNIYKMTPKGAFYYHYYENFYTLSYIDKMWGIMRREAFPDELKL